VASILEEGMVTLAEPAYRPRLEILRDPVLRARRRCGPVDLSSPAAERVVYRGRAHTQPSAQPAAWRPATAPAASRGPP
jgi:hypothetical protein